MVVSQDHFTVLTMRPPGVKHFVLQITYSLFAQGLGRAGDLLAEAVEIYENEICGFEEEVEAMNKSAQLWQV